MRHLKVLNQYTLSDGSGRIIVGVQTPEDMQGFSQAQAKAELYQHTVLLDLGNDLQKYEIWGFEMMG